MRVHTEIGYALYTRVALLFIRDFKIGDYGQRTTNEDERELGRGALRMLKTKHNYVVRCVPARYDSFPGFSRSL